MDFDGVRADGVLWIEEYGEGWIPLCPKHHLPLKLIFNSKNYSRYECPEDRETFDIQREYSEQKEYIKDKLNSKDLKKKKFLNIDGEYVAIAEDKVSTSDGKYFVKAILTDSKVGQRLVVYAGEKGKEKSQIFIEPDIKRLAFDQTDTHPSEIFLKLEATFDDGSSFSIKKNGSL